MPTHLNKCLLLLPVLALMSGGCRIVVNRTSTEVHNDGGYVNAITPTEQDQDAKREGDIPIELPTLPLMEVTQ